MQHEQKQTLVLKKDKSVQSNMQQRRHTGR